MLRDQMYYPEQQQTPYTPQDFALEQEKVLKNLQHTKTKREFDTALKLAEKAIIYKQNPSLVMKQLSKLIHSKSPKRENTKFAELPANLSITAPIGKPKAAVLKLPKAQKF